MRDVGQTSRLIAVCWLVGITVMSVGLSAAESATDPSGRDPAIAAFVQQGSRPYELFVAYNCNSPVTPSPGVIYACPAILRTSNHPQVPLDLPGSAMLRLSGPAHIVSVRSEPRPNASRGPVISFHQIDERHAKLRFGRARSPFKVRVILKFNNSREKGEEDLTFVAEPTAVGNGNGHARGWALPPFDHLRISRVAVAF